MKFFNKNSKSKEPASSLEKARAAYFENQAKAAEEGLKEIAIEQAGRQAMEQARAKMAAGVPAAPKAQAGPTVIHRAANHQPKADAGNPAATAAPGLITASQFATPEIKMERSEFEKLNAGDKMRFFKEGGKLVENSVSSLAALKAQATAAGVATKPSFDTLKGIERTKASMAFETRRKEFFRATAARQIHDEDMAAMSEAKSGSRASSTGVASTANGFTREARIAARAKELEAQLS
ncbi:hypothetical protein JIN84_05170 [Luteolibacter yonseiensis]|uniref:Uncharacterized protein n=1 Tax=Luteolibacter yonseiensis TaxID=1144680 RepID=A0A934R1E9_9BACT|nr:hypothetical protein [Luteolibacter yonseiensis]MBK1814994.1 hypothetical protein [Luteolibacter yonseiensis]